MDEKGSKEIGYKAEIDAVINYLAFGAVTAVVKSADSIELSRKGALSLDVSLKAVTYLARKGWLKRDGKLVQLTDKAPDLRPSPVQNALNADAIENDSTGLVKRSAAESPIDYLVSRKDKNGIPLLANSEWQAGDRLRSDFTRANMLPSIGMRWGEPMRSSSGPGGGAAQSDAAMAARQRVTKALDAVGPEFSGLLIDVCCFLKGLEQVEMERRWPQRSAKLMLRAGLSILSRHYAPRNNTAGKVRSWGTDDYRPVL